MAKYLKRYAARTAVQKLKESGNWIAMRRMLLETDEGDLEIKAGDSVILGATEKGELAIKDPQAIVVIADDAVASEVVNSITNAADLSDVEFIDEPALNSALEGTSVDAIISGLMDAEEGDSTEVPVVSTADEKSVEEKCESIAQNTISGEGAIYCERAYFEDEAPAAVPVEDITEPAASFQDFSDYDAFKAEVTKRGGSLTTGNIELYLTADDKFVGYFNKDTNMGKIFNDASFDSEEEMNNFDASQSEAARSITANGNDLMPEGCCEAVVESALKAYEESTRSVKDLNTLTESLVAAGVKEEMLGKVANSFVKHSMKEGVSVFDTKLGKVVASFAERVDAENYIADSGEEARFTKRFFG